MSDAKAKSRGGSRTHHTAAKAIAFALFVLLTFATGSYAFFAPFDQSRIAHGVSITGLDVGGRTEAEALAFLRERLAEIELTFDAAGNKTAIRPAFIENPEEKTAAVGFDAADAVASAWSVGRSGNTLQSTAARIKAYFFGVNVRLPYRLDRAALARELRSRLSTGATPARNARFVISLHNDGVIGVAVTKEKTGKAFAIETAVRAAEDRLGSLSNETIRVPMIEDRPELTGPDIIHLKDEIAPVIARAPLTISAKKRSWKISKAMLADWVVPVKTGSGIVLGLDGEKARKYLDGIAPVLATEPQNAVFTMTEGRVIEITASVDGDALDFDKAIAAIENHAFGRGDDAAEAIELPLAAVAPEITTEKSNPYGIKEIIGIGESNFRGSPRNRRTNIAVGAKSLDGLIIQPEEEFSLLKALGEINAERGYLQELVIKGNKTVPEYGGGLCQIGSTTFRAALDSGLPITERRNHSYRVPYYERDGAGRYIGPGKDATIYDPAPDFKFINDTGSAMVVKTKISGDRLTFTFWGAKDGRVAEQTTARVYNIKPPPEKKIVETTELPPGVEKCTEKPHEGADAVFTYTVTYPSGDVKKNDFYSRYRPWGEVCLVGVDPAAAASATSSATLPSQDASGAAGN